MEQLEGLLWGVRQQDHQQLIPQPAGLGHRLPLLLDVQVGPEASAQPASLEQGLDVRPAVQPIGATSQWTGAQQHQGDLDRLQWIHARKPRAGRTAPQK